MTEPTSSSSAARGQLLLTSKQAVLLLELAHKAVWSGALVREIAPVIAQLEALAPPPSSPPADRFLVDTGTRGA